MFSLTFLSTATSSMDEDQLLELVATIRPKNEAHGITGVMLYADGSFVETLEGPQDAVEATVGRIALDPRHHGMIVALRERIEQRAYPDWSMGFRSVRADRLRSVPGFNDYMQAQRALVEHGRKVARPEVVHRVFRDAWRSSGP